MGPDAKIFFVPLNKSARTLAHTHSQTHRLRHMHSHRVGLAIGSTRIFLGGPINNGQMDSRLFIYLFIYFLIYLFAAPRRFSVDTVKNVRDW